MEQRTLLDRHLDAGITPDLERPRWPWALFALLLVPLWFLVVAGRDEVVIHPEWFGPPVPDQHPVAVELGHVGYAPIHLVPDDSG